MYSSCIYQYQLLFDVCCYCTGTRCFFFFFFYSNLFTCIYFICTYANVKWEIGCHFIIFKNINSHSNKCIYCWLHLFNATHSVLHSFCIFFYDYFEFVLHHTIIWLNDINFRNVFFTKRVCVCVYAGWMCRVCVRPTV